ncbi:MAG: hypothetical protein ABR921_15080 [Candidatus Sulfotelmatobacter sp.]|jgi:hypothetical protein
MYRSTRKRVTTLLGPLTAILLASLILQGCNAINPFCGSARPAPNIASLSVTSITFAEVERGYPLSVNGSAFVSSSVVVVNGIEVSTEVASSTLLQVTLTTAEVPATGIANILVKTPSGNSGDLGCKSGGNSRTLVLMVT